MVLQPILIVSVGQRTVCFSLTWVSLFCKSVSYLLKSLKRHKYVSVIIKIKYKNVFEVKQEQLYKLYNQKTFY